jgi:hypothetical protein
MLVEARARKERELQEEKNKNKFMLMQLEEQENDMDDIKRGEELELEGEILICLLEMTLGFLKT